MRIALKVSIQTKAPRRRKKRKSGQNPRAIGTNPRAKLAVAQLRAMPYAAYLRTKHWRDLRARVLQRWQGQCEECGERAREVHHKTYERLGREHMQDLTPLCDDCHRREHPTKSVSPHTGNPPSRSWASASASGESKGA